MGSAEWATVEAARSTVGHSDVRRSSRGTRRHNCDPSDFWGAATGPGGDPADLICDLDGGVGTVGALAAKPFKIKVKIP